jgi:error-prone DNA polymerase
MTGYAELAVTTNFSFLRGAAHPQEMVAAADDLGLDAIGIADRNSFAGVVRAYSQWKKLDKEAAEEAAKTGKPKRKIVKLIVGVRLVTVDGFEVIAYPTNRAAYGRLSRLVTEGNRLLVNKKGDCSLELIQIIRAAMGQMFIALPPDDPSADFVDQLGKLSAAASGRVFLAGVHRHRGDERRRLGLLDELGARTGAPLVAVNDAYYHVPERRQLADVLTCIREKCKITEAGFRLTVNEERHLKPPEEMARLFADFPEAVERTIAIADACQFSLGELKYEYPDEPVPPGKTPQQHLEDLTWEGAKRRYPRHLYPEGVPDDVVKRLKEELAIIEGLDFARYFLTVHDVVDYARTVL